MAKKKQAAATLYSVHPAVAYARTVLDNVPAKTGKSLDEWVKLIKKSGLTEDKERRDWLKKEHKLGGTTASMLVDHAGGKSNENTDPDTYLRLAVQYVEAMYAGGKAGLRPLHDALIELGRGLGPDVKVCPCKTMVPLYRNHVFAQIKPTTKTRIDLGLALRKFQGKLPERIEETGGLAKDDRITHRIPITAAKDIDAEVQRRLEVAYALDDEK